MTSIELRPLRLNEVDGLSRLLWRAFERNPLFRYLFRARWYAGRGVPLLFGVQARNALRHGCSDVAVEHRQPVAAVIWSSPSQIRPPPVRRILTGLPAYLAVGTLFIDRLPDLRRMIPTTTTGLIEPHNRRFGFEVRDESRPFKDGSPIWSMRAKGR